MQTARRSVAALILAAAIAGPMSITAVASPQQATVQVRVYDRNHKDYHNWDDHENQAWGVYLTNNHRTVIEYSKARRSDQDRYWTWRHAHPDGR